MKYAKLILSLLMVVSITACSRLETTDIPVIFTKEIKLKTITETVETTETDYVYVICDVVCNYDDEPNGIYATNLVCEMPNGEFHKYTIEDAPEGKVELVCFRTNNQDDYKTYEVVAVR